MYYDGMERRRWPRVNLALPMRYRGVGEFGQLPMDSEVKDISEGGIRFACDRFLPKDSKLVVNLNLIDISNIKATVKVVWATRDSHTNRYEVGVEFDNIPAESKCQISSLVRKNPSSE